jgi:predicted cobalt transporter CbtA
MSEGRKIFWFALVILNAVMVGSHLYRGNYSQMMMQLVLLGLCLMFFAMTEWKSK